MGNLFFENKVPLSDKISDFVLDYNINVCSLDEILVVYSKEGNKPITFFGLNNDFLKQSFVSFPTDINLSSSELFCPEVSNSRSVKRSFFQIQTQTSSNPLKIWNYYSCDGLQTGKKVHSIIDTTINLSEKAHVTFQEYADNRLTQKNYALVKLVNVENAITETVVENEDSYSKNQINVILNYFYDKNTLLFN